MTKRFLCGNLIVRSLFCCLIQLSQRLTKKDQLPICTIEGKQRSYIIVNGGRVLDTWTEELCIDHRHKMKSPAVF